MPTTDLAITSITIEPGRVTAKFNLNGAGHSLVFDLKEDKLGLGNPVTVVTRAIVEFINVKYSLGLSSGGDNHEATTP